MDLHVGSLRELGSRVSCYCIVSYMCFQHYDMFFIHISSVIFSFVSIDGSVTETYYPLRSTYFCLMYRVI